MSVHYRLRSVSKFAACRITFLAIACASTAPSLAQSYTITDLGTLGGSLSRATGINNAGQISGRSYMPSSVTAGFLWGDGKMINIGSLGNETGESFAAGINDFAAICGSSEPLDQQTHAFRWQDGRMVDLGTLGGVGSRGYAINNLGDVTGRALPVGSSVNHAVMWIGEEIIDLGVLVPGYDTYGFGINDLREVAGWGWVTATSVKGFVWRDGLMCLLPGLAGEDSSAIAINDSGWIAGDSRAADGATHPVIWISKTAPAIPIIVDLGLPQEFDIGLCHALNNVGVVVGTYWEAVPGWDNYNIFPFIWEDGRTQLLDDLIPPDSGWDLDFPLGINDAGQIVGEGVPPGGDPEVHHGFLLTPVAPGDIDHDGDVDVTDLLLLLGAWGPCADCGDCLADLDDDCAVGVTDLLILLGNWG